MDRKQRILELLDQKNTLYLRELETEFPEVSTMTLRRDLSGLEAMGQAIRIKGGVRSVKSLEGGRQEDVYDRRLAVNAEAKAKIAALAVPFIETGRSIFMDSGTTTLGRIDYVFIYALALVMAFYCALPVQGSIECTLQACGRKKYLPTVNIIGGQLNRLNATVCGSQAMDFVKGYNFDVAFVVPSAFSLENGLSCGNDSECELKRYIIQNASMKIALVDSGKFGKSMPFTFASLSEIQILITDTKPEEDVMRFAETHDIKIIYK